MESRWYLFPGQTIENTKISNRAHALHITSSAWSGITQHLDRKKRIQEAIDKERKHKEALKMGSQVMTKNWDNSIENLRLRKEEERKERMNRKKEDKLQMFYEMKAEQDIVRKQYVDKVRKEIFISTGYPKELNSALLLSETLYEREKQQEFNEKIKQKNDEIKQKFDAEIIEKDRKQREEDARNRQEKRRKEQEVAKILRKQVEEIQMTKAGENNERIRAETEDRIKAAREEELLKEFEIEEKKKRMHEMALEKKKSLLADQKRQEIIAKEEMEMEKATQFYSDAKQRIDCLMKAKDKESKEEAIKLHEILAQKVATIQESKDAAENERIAKVLAERDAQELAKLEEKRIKQEKAIQDRLDDRRQYLERLEQEKTAENEIKKWEFLNRCKATEAMKEHDENARRKKWERILEYRKELLDQMSEEIEIKRKDKEIDELMERVSFQETDDMFFKYANEVLELAKSKKRNTYPIKKVIQAYKKSNSLEQPTRHCRCCKKNDKI